MNRKILLIEPNYKNKYPPMGLMKLATFYKKLGDDVWFYKGDLQELAVKIILKELIFSLNYEYPDVKWCKYTPKLHEFIKYGKKDKIQNSSVFCDSKILKLLGIFRTKYTTKDYFKNPRFDVVCITTLFTFYWDITIETINYAKQLCKDKYTVFVGGIMSSILSNEVEEATGIKPIVGILDDSSVIDKKGTNVDSLPLDYSILDEIEYKYPTSNSYFGYMTRGCPRRCSFCAVKKLEPNFVHHIHLKEQIQSISNLYGEKKDLLLLDNNVLYSDEFDKIIDEIKECGFSKNATYIPSNQYEITIKNLRKKKNIQANINKMVEIYLALLDKLKKNNLDDENNLYFDTYTKITDADCYYPYTATTESILDLDVTIKPIYNKYFENHNSQLRFVDFNQGIDARLIVQFPEKLIKLSEVNIRPLRIAFDSWNMKDIYKKAVEMSKEVGITQLSNYILYNSQEDDDTPDNFYQRLELNIKLCDLLNVNIYSFPMKYHPISDPKYFKNRDFIGKHWKRKHIRAIQAILNSTKGKIGKGKSFFEAAFGKNIEQYNELLMMPEAFIIERHKYNRVAYEEYRSNGGKLKIDDIDIEKYGDLANEWKKKYFSLSESQMKEANCVIYNNIFNEDEYKKINIDAEIRAVLSYYEIKRYAEI